jgi:hypothetical protein
MGLEYEPKCSCGRIAVIINATFYDTFQHLHYKKLENSETIINSHGVL